MKIEDLKNEAEYSSPAKKRQRGYEFERYLYDTFESQSMSVKRPFKKAGEQIDGGIYFDGSWYLVEAKWHGEPLPVSEVYSFKGKVDGKLAGTKGFFISWSGYSKECADALCFGKELNILLCDSADVERAEKDGWSAVLKEKLMFAALYGAVYVPDQMRRSINEQEIGEHRVEIFVEGQSDVDIISSILLLKDFTRDFRIIPCVGKYSAIKMASTLPKFNDAKRILILDSDGNPDQDNELSKLDLVDTVISIDPQIEALFYPNSDEPKKDFYLNARKNRQSVADHARSLLENVFRNDPQSFISKLRAAILGKR